MPTIQKEVFNYFTCEACCEEELYQGPPQFLNRKRFCRGCKYKRSKESLAKSRLKNKEKRSKVIKDNYWDDVNKSREKARGWYWKTPEKCREQSKERARKAREKFPERALFRAAKQRAKNKGLEFSIGIQDVVIPDVCPALGVPIIAKIKGSVDWQYSPSIDRINNSKGYIKGNIQVISRKANFHKNNSTLKDLKKIVAWMESLAYQEGKLGKVHAVV